MLDLVSGWNQVFANSSSRGSLEEEFLADPVSTDQLR